jgi:hypothetical protein
LVAGTSLLASTAQAQAKAMATPALQGVWRIVETSVSGENPATNSNPQPGYYFFTQKRFAVSRVVGDKPRTYKGGESTASVEDLRNVLQFAAASGTYEVRGNTIRASRETSLRVANMDPGNFVVYSFKTAGDTLWLTTTEDQTGPMIPRQTAKLVRVE